MTVVCVVALDGVISFDLGIPCDVFTAARLADGTSPYEVRVCAPHRGIATAAWPAGGTLFWISAPWPLTTLREAELVVVPGHATFAGPSTRRTVALLRSAATRGARIASICTGAFLLAKAGLLDGRRATTHWEYAGELARDHPEVDVDPAALYVDSGRILTSAGMAAGLDLCLHIIRSDHGAAVAAETARRLVMPPQRDGGQAQFIRTTTRPEDGSNLAPTLAWIEENLEQPLRLADIAAHECTSVRNLNRRFHAQLNTTPLQWLLSARVRRAQELLETSDLQVEQVAALAGFGDAASLRAHFNNRLRTSPLAYRRAFRARSVSGSALRTR